MPDCKDCRVELTEANTYKHTRGKRNQCKRCYCRANSTRDRELNELTREGAERRDQPWQQYEIDLLAEAIREGTPMVVTAELMGRSYWAVASRSYQVRHGMGLVATEQVDRTVRGEARRRGPIRPVVVCPDCFCTTPCFCG